MDLNVAIIGRSGSGKTTFLSNISPQYKYHMNTRFKQENIKAQKSFQDLKYSFNFVDTVGFSNKKLVCWDQFELLKQGINFFIILVCFHKIKHSSNEVQISQQSWQHAKVSISQLTQWGVKNQKIMVIGNIFDNQNQYQLLGTRQLQLHLLSKKIKYYEFNLKQKDQCYKVLQKLVESLSSLSYSKHFKGNTTFNACMIGFVGTGKSSVSAAMTNNKVSLESTTSNKIFTVQKNHVNSNFTVNLIDTPGLNFKEKKTLIALSKLKEFDFHIYVMDLSDLKCIQYLRMFFDLILSWQKSQHTILIIGNKVDQAKINECDIRDELLEGIGQRYRFNYIETNALGDQKLTSFCLDYVIDIFATHKVKLKQIQEKKQREIDQRLRRQQQYRKQQEQRQQNLRRQLQRQRRQRQRQQEENRKKKQRQQDAQRERRRRQEQAKKNSGCQIM